MCSSLVCKFLCSFVRLFASSLLCLCSLFARLFAAERAHTLHSQHTHAKRLVKRANCVRAFDFSSLARLFARAHSELLLFLFLLQLLCSFDSLLLLLLALKQSKIICRIKSKRILNEPLIS